MRLSNRYGPILSKTKYLLWAMLLAAIVMAGHYLGAGPLIRDLLAWISGLGALAPLVFIAIYVLACVLFVPGSILTIGAGLLFGVLWGSIYVSIASTLGATCAFLIGRYLARDRIARWFEANPRFRNMDRAVAAAGWKFVGLTRLSPIFPFNVLNYAFGLTRVPVKDYVLASWAGMLPGTVMYVYIGSLARDLGGLGGKATASRPAYWALDFIGLAATVAVAVYAARIARTALAQRGIGESSNGANR